MSTFVLYFVIALVLQALCQKQTHQQQQNFFRDKQSYQSQQNSFLAQQNTFSTRNSPQVPPSRSQLNFQCPDKNGRYPTSQCDGYIECVDGVPEEKLCPDGLLFNPATGPFSFPCQYPIDVDCTGRTSTQSPQATEDCPHQFGYYRMGDAANCGQFRNCVDGRGYVFDCPEGLAFNGDTFRCDWPDQVPTCDAEAFLGFTCPQEGDGRSLDQGEYRYFKSPRDCQRYFICVSNRPRLYNCGEGNAFNNLLNVCDGIENVTRCAGPQYNSNYDRSVSNNQAFLG